jgi:hypothetical protein
VLMRICFSCIPDKLLNAAVANEMWQHVQIAVVTEAALDQPWMNSKRC